MRFAGVLVLASLCLAPGASAGTVSQAPPIPALAPHPLQAQPQAQPEPVPTSEDLSQDLKTLQDEQRKAHAIIDSLAQPLAAQPDPNATEAPPPAVPGQEGEDLVAAAVPAPLKGLLGNAAFQRILRYFQDRDFAEGSAQILAQMPKAKMPLSYAEFGCMVFVFLLRLWRVSKAKSFLGRLFINVWSFLLYAGLSWFVIPWVILGNSYAHLIGGLIEVAFRKQ